MSLDDTIKPDDWRDVKVPVFGGLNKALDPDNLEMGDLVRGENICLIDDTITMANGFDPYHDTVDNDPWVGDAMKPFKYRLTDGTLGQILFTTAGLYRDNGSAWLQVTGGTFSGDVNSLFSVIAIPWADVIVFTNGLDPVQVYDPATQTITNLQGPGGANIYAKALAVYDSSLFLLNTVESGTARPQRLRYCDKGDITNWDTGVAGFRDLLDGTDPIMCGRLLGTYLIVYRTRGIHRVDISINDLERFQIDNMIPDNGVTSIDAVINVEKNRHLVWGRDNFYLYDGGFELEPIGSDVTDFMFTPFRADDGSAMFSAEDLTQVHRHHLMYFESLNEILCVYQSENDTELTSALLYRYGEKTWTTRKFPSRPVRGSDLASPFVHISWDDLVGTWDDLIGSWLDLIGPTGQIYPIFASTLGGVETNTPTFKFDFLLTTQWVGTDIVATDIPTTFETKDFSEYPLSARLDWVDMRIDAPQEVVVEFSIDEGGTWDILRAFTTTGLTIVRLHRQIHYESIRFRITGFFWELKSMNLRVTPETEIGETGAQPTFIGPSAPVLTPTLGSIRLDIACNRGSMAIKDFFLYRSINDGAFVHIETIEATLDTGISYIGDFTETPSFVSRVRYYAVARDGLLNLSDDSNMVTVNGVPTITSLSPATVIEDAFPILVLTINGTGFVPNSTATYAGGAKTVTYISSTQLTITLVEADLDDNGSFDVIVTNPALGGGVSNTVAFIITSNPVPTISSLNPADILEDSAGQNITITGTNFIPTTTGTFDGNSRTVTYVSATELTMTLLTSDFVDPGVFDVIVTNPPPDGGASNTVTFEVTSLAPSYTREIFLDNTHIFFLGNQWTVPAGVTSLDILAVSPGNEGGVCTDPFEFFSYPGGGGGGGGVLVVKGIPVTPLEGIDVFGASGLVRRVIGDILAQAGTGGLGGQVSGAGVGQDGTANSAPNGGTIDAGSRGGSGGGGGYIEGSAPGAGGTGAGSAGNGGASSNVGPTAFDFADASGGGGGAGGNGTAGTGAGGAGDGGDGIIPPDHSFGAWGTDIGENGYFGGGGPGVDMATFAQGSRGLGGGAANTGGGGGWSGATPLAGYTGIVVIVYETP